MGLLIFEQYINFFNKYLEKLMKNIINIINNFVFQQDNISKYKIKKYK